MRHLGTVRPGSTIEIPFATYDSNDPSASVTLTGLAVTDIEVYKDGSMTQRASDSGYALLDTDGIDLDGITGIHGFTIDLADNTTAGFWASGSRYTVVVSSVTVDAATINFVAATFRIGYPDALLDTTIATLSSQTSFTLTAGPAEDDALNGCVVVIHDVASAVQLGFAVVSDYVGSTKTVTLAAGVTFTAAATDNISFYPPANTRWLGATAQTGRDVGTSVLLSSGTGTGQVSLSSGLVTLAGVTHTGAVIPTVSTLTGHTAQTGDSFARLGAPAGASVSADVAAVKTDTGNLVTRITSTLFAGITSLAEWLGLIAGKQTGNSTARTELRATGAGSGTFDETTDSAEAIRDRGDAAWTTGGGASITDILNVHAVIPFSIDLADTATVRLGLMLTNALDDLPSTAEITPGTISIHRKATGGTSWSAVVTDAACSEQAGMVYYDEVFDSGTGYAAGDSIRVTFKSQKITVSANDYEVTDANGVMFQTHIREAMRGTDSAATASALATAQADLDTLTGSDGATLATSQPNYAPLKPTVAGRTLDVSAGGEAGIDLANVGSPTTTLNLSGTTIKTATDVETKVDTVDTVVDAIKAITDAIGATAAANLARSCGSAGIVFGTAATGTLSTTQASSNLSEATDDHYIGCTIVWLTGVLAGQRSDITDYTGTGGILTFTALTEAPSNGDTFILV